MDKSKTLENLGDNIKRLRSFSGLTQEELGLKVSLSKESISRLELGKQKNIGMMYLLSICRVLKVDLEELVVMQPRAIPIKIVVSDENVQAMGEIVKQFQKIIKK